MLGGAVVGCEYISTEPSLLLSPANTFLLGSRLLDFVSSRCVLLYVLAGSELHSWYLLSEPLRSHL